MKTIGARFDSECPQCGRPILVGDPVAKSDFDWVWRCPACAAVFQELFETCGPDRDSQGRSRPFLTIKDLEIHKARRAAILAKLPPKVS